ncbi:hypothetical protein [Pseudomonas amygdali]|uniref:Uncharacterized protein n=2 Tax=Pseudomonas amygdali pv. lachrymans TaxID=53707 RepID=A0AAD0PWV8_PSEAV|nr:hypothetical protein [Pseudomonas amygdali]AXH60235.1 hypothetical protein PLA107_034175 [Pseudomonas amygdali pv. lachrymans str. M301315]RMT06535.1 hypothetical protein ALP54_04067 [Pseudomonas amygdali pv. lachrymans]
MTKTAKIRPKRPHIEFFAFTNYPFTTIEYLLKNDMPLTFHLLQVREPEMQRTSGLSCKDLVEILNEVAEEFGCRRETCPETLVNHEIDGSVAHAVVLSAAKRAMSHADSRDKLITLMQPVAAVLDKLSGYGTLKPAQVTCLPSMVSMYKTVSGMSFRSEINDLSQFDSARAEKQARISCQRVLDNKDFDTLPPYFAEAFYEHLALKLGSKHGKSQAESKLAAGYAPDH